MPQVVKCSICGGKAVAIIHYARLRLCRKHFLEFVEKKVERTIKRYRLIGEGDRVVVAVSGGKDSSTLATILSKLSSKLGFKLYFLYIDLGINVYSEENKRKVIELSRKTGIPLIIVNVRELLSVSVPELALRIRRPVCSVCGVVKRYIMNAVAVELKANALAMGHNLDDMAAYILKEFFNQNLNQISKLGPKTETIEGLAVGRIRPLYEVYERESLLYALLSGTPFLPDECPHVRRGTMEFKLKELLDGLEESFPGVKIGFMRRIARNVDSYPKLSQKLTRCKACGLIASGELCSFCKMTKQVLGEPLGAKVREYVRRKIVELGLS